MIKRYLASKDSVITNAYESDLVTKATGSNQGEADTLQVFSIYGQGTTSSIEKARTLIQFPISQMQVDRTAGTIPASGSVNFYLNLFNAKHPLTLPKQFTLEVAAISGSDWDEGTGLDTDEFTDVGTVNWDQALTSSGGATYWVNEGGDYYSGSYVAGSRPPTYTVYFDKGYENLSLDVTSMAEEWLASNFSNYGFCIKLTGSQEDSLSSWYVKKFFARGSEFVMQRPVIEARWDASTLDDRTDFYASSSLATAAENANIIYLFNRSRGTLRNIPGMTGPIYVKLWDDRISGSAVGSVITGGLTSVTGVYTASVTVDTTASVLYDRWYNAALSTCYATGSIDVNVLAASFDNRTTRYVASMPGLQNIYSEDEVVRLNLFTRERNWTPTIYSVSTADTEFSVIKNVYYKVRRVIDDFVVVDYLTGSNETRLSYGVSGSYFDLDMSIFQTGYMYEISYLHLKPDSKYEELNQRFRFRVEKYDS